jgi:hypothetical protein
MDDPQSATGVVLDAIAESRGLTREPASYSYCAGYVDGTVGTLIPTTARVRISNGTYWHLDTAVTISASPTDCTLVCSTAGAEAADAGDIVEIIDAISGWTSVTNDAVTEDTIGTAEESDTALRERLLESRGISGHCTDNAIESRVVALDFIDEAICLSNRTLTTDIYNTPGKAFQIFIYPSSLSTSEEETLAETMYGSAGLPAGIQCYGTETATVTDVHGLETSVCWSYATPVYIYVSVIIGKNTEGTAYPTDGDTLVESACIHYVNSLSVGGDVIPVSMVSTIVAGYVDDDGNRVDGVPGIRTMTIYVSTTPAPSSTSPISVSMVQIARTGTTYVTVTST